MNDKLMTLLQDYKRDIVNLSAEHFDRMILYGSYARGDNREDSDIDIMFLVDLSAEPMEELEMKIADCTYDFNMAHGTDIMPMVQNTDHFNYWKNAYMFYRNVDAEGVVI